MRSKDQIKFDFDHVPSYKNIQDYHNGLILEVLLDIRWCLRRLESKLDDNEDEPKAKWKKK